MRKGTLVLWLALIALACAGEYDDYHITIDKIEYRNVPEKYSLGSSPVITKKLLKGIIQKAAIKVGSRGITANLDEYADQIYKNIDNLIIHSGLDPAQTPEMHTGFNFTLLLINYHGELDLTNGWLSDLSTLHRGSRDVIVTYDHNTENLQLTIPIEFNDLMFTFDYSAKLMGLGPRGGIEGKIKDLKLEVQLSFDWKNLKASMDTFYITNSGHISFHFTGNVLVDWLLNILSEVVTTVLKDVILLVVEQIVKGTLTDVVDEINSVVGSILNHTSTAAATSLF